MVTRTNTTLCGIRPPGPDTNARALPHGRRLVVSPSRTRMRARSPIPTPPSIKRTARCASCLLLFALSAIVELPLGLAECVLHFAGRFVDLAFHLRAGITGKPTGRVLHMPFHFFRGALHLILHAVFRQRLVALVSHIHTS